jgi:hypothetical protein
VIVPGPERVPSIGGHDGVMGVNSQRRSGLQPERCTATAKRTGERCGRWAVVGCAVCWVHGGGKKDVVANGQLRTVAAQLGVAGLPPSESIRVIQRALSSQMLKAAGVLEAAAQEGRPIGAAEYERFESAADKALIAARIALQHGVEETTDAHDEETGELLAKAVSWTVDGVLDILPGLSHEQRAQVREYGLRTAMWAFSDGSPATRPEAPKLLPDHVAVAELLPAPRRRRSAADDVWRRAQPVVDQDDELVDAELVDDQDEGEVGDGDEGDAPDAAA